MPVNVASLTHANRHAAAGPDAVTPAAIGAASSASLASLDALVQAGVPFTAATAGAALTITLPTPGQAAWDVTLTAPTLTLTLAGATASKECVLTILLRQDATGGRTVAWPASVVWPGAVPVISTAGNAVDVVTLSTVNAGATWFASVLNRYGPITVVEAVTITDPGTQTSTVGFGDALQIVASSNLGGPLTFAAINLPAGMSITASTGLISGTPSTAASYAPRVTATANSGAASTLTFAWVVSAGTVVTVSNPGARSNTVSTAVSLQIVASDSNPAGVLNYSTTNLPPGLTINANTGLISGTLTSTAATYSVTVRATDQNNVAGTTSFVWTVQAAAANTVTVTNPGNKSGVVGTPTSVQISASSSGGSALTYAATGLPAGVAINSSTGLISGTPTTVANYTSVVTVTDATAATGSTTFSWIVTGSVVAPAGLVGFATLGGGTTGGTTAYTVTTAADSGAGSLRDAVSVAGRKITFNNSYRIILGSALSLNSNTTIDGTGHTITIDGNATVDGLVAVGKSNIILRSLYITRCGPGGAAGGSSTQDCIRLDNTHNVWITHCDLSQGNDKALTLQGVPGAYNVTMDYTQIHDHAQALEIGDYADGPLTSGTNTSGAAQQTFTMHHCYIGPNVGYRFPNLSYGRVHMFNCVVTDWNGGYGTQSKRHGTLLLERCLYRATSATNAVQTNTGSNAKDTSAGYIRENGNLYYGGAAFSNAFPNDTTQVFGGTGGYPNFTGIGTTYDPGGGPSGAPPYTYSLDVINSTWDTALLNGTGTSTMGPY